MYDLVIRHGTIVDGTGEPRFMADIGVTDGKIADIGPNLGTATREIDAGGMLVTPGWVDAHTHYDGQVTWDPYLTPSCWHGVTTVVMGNCGVGFAPVVPADRDRLIMIMEGVEDIPGTALHEGIKWEWESFPEYLDALDSRRFALDVATQVPHAALRTYVMGDRGIRNETATAEDVERMSALLLESLRAGALGVSTSRTAAHLTGDGEDVPGTFAGVDEMFGFGRAIQAAGHGVLEMATDLVLDLPEGQTEAGEFAWMTRLSREYGVRISNVVVQNHTEPEKWRNLLRRTEEARGQGADILMQIGARAGGLIMNWQSSYHPFMGRPAYEATASLPFSEQKEKLKDPAIRSAILAQKLAKAWNESIPVGYDNMYRLEGPDGILNYEPVAEESILSLASSRGKHPDEIIYDAMMEHDGNGYIYATMINYGRRNLDHLYELLHHPASLLGISDAGAHCGVVCDASVPSFLLSYWVRDRVRGKRLSLEHAVSLQTRNTAYAYGLKDRGTLEVGKKADINVIDFERLRLRPPRIVADLPAGGRRVIQEVDGYHSTITSGIVTFEEGHPTGELPGRLVRGPKVAAPVVQTAK
ncbi:MAG: amidohydrolase family protein [Sphingomonadaceae bacterium]